MCVRSACNDMHHHSTASKACKTQFNIQQSIMQSTYIQQYTAILNKMQQHATEMQQHTIRNHGMKLNSTTYNNGTDMQNHEKYTMQATTTTTCINNFNFGLRLYVYL